MRYRRREFTTESQRGEAARKNFLNHRGTEDTEIKTLAGSETGKS
jgi:hypothetical protein